MVLDPESLLTSQAAVLSPDVPFSAWQHFLFFRRSLPKPYRVGICCRAVLCCFSIFDLSLLGLLLLMWNLAVFGIILFRYADWLLEKGYSRNTIHPIRTA